MGALFSHHHHGHHRHGKKPAGAPKVQITDHDRAVLDLKVAKDRLKRYQSKMRGESIRLTEQAKELVQAGKKDRALLVLKMRRLREEEGSKAEGQLMNVEQLITQIEWETEQLKVFDALKSGNQALEAIHKIMSLEEVEKLMADTADSMEYEQEISRLLSGNLSVGAEEEVMKEFEALEKEATAKVTPTPSVPVPVPPVVPAAAAAATTKPEELPAVVPAPVQEEEAKPAVVQEEPAAAAMPELPEVPTKKPVPRTKKEEAKEEEEATEKPQQERVAVMG